MSQFVIVENNKVVTLNVEKDKFLMAVKVHDDIYLRNAYVDGKLKTTTRSNSIDFATTSRVGLRNNDSKGDGTALITWKMRSSRSFWNI